jgi:nicotinate-nucleotide--dimethylbenzimidazole phosphoribosyltransferase
VVALDTTADAAPTGESPIAVNMPLPMPDEAASGEAGARLATIDFAGSGLGALTPVVRFAAGTQGQPVPRPWQSVRMFLLHADHEGGVAAGETPADSARRLADAERGEGAWAVLAGAAGVSVRTVRCPGNGAPIEYADALREPDVDAALEYGWQLAQDAVDEGTDLIVLGASGAGAAAAAVAVIVTTTNGEIPALLGRITRGGRIDDSAWMRRCAAIRDALHRTRSRARDPKAILGMLGGADHAVATGIVLGAASRKTPVLLDGPVGVAAALVARDFGAQTRHWLILPDDGGHPAVRLAAEVLGVEPVLDLKLGLGEGTTALAALPLLRSAITLAATLPPIPPAEPAAEGA